MHHYLRVVSLAIIFTSCTINQPYVRATEQEKVQNLPETLTDTSFAFRRVSDNLDSILGQTASGTFVHIISTTCPPCVKKLFVLDTLSQIQGLPVMNIVVDDWIMNQNAKRIFTGKTAFNEVWILDHNFFNKDFSNRERIEQLQKLLCSDCNFLTYYSTGYVWDSNFKLLQERDDLENYFKTYLPDLNSDDIEKLAQVFAVMPENETGVAP